jgi:hypothetical protein
MDTVLEVIHESISSDGVPATLPTRAMPSPQVIQQERLFIEDDDPNWSYHEQVFDDNGEGTGIEGDLEEEDS